MNRLHLIALCTLVAPAMVLGSSALLAQESSAKTGIDGEDRTMEQRYETKTGSDGKLQSNPQKPGAKGAMDQNYMSAAPAQGVHASDLIGSEVKARGNESIGSVSDLIIDQDGQLAAVVVGVGGFLGMGEKNVAISWDQVTRSEVDGKQELRINQTRENLTSAPEYKVQK